SGSADVYNLTWSVYAPNGHATPSSGSGPAFTFTPVGSGPVVVTLTATDEANQSTLTSVVILVTQVSRGVTVTPPGTAQEGQALTWTANVTAPPGVTFSYVWQVTAPNGTPTTVNTGASNVLTVPSAVTGHYEVSLTATGSDGSTAAAGPPAAGTAVNVTNVPPSVTITVAPPPAPRNFYQEGDTVRLTSSLTDPGPDLTFATYQWHVTGPDAFAAGGVQPGLSFTPFEVGDYAVTLTVTDSNRGATTTPAVTVHVAHVRSE